MASIDQYKHKHIGFIECPSTEDFVHNNTTRKIALYELLEDISPKENDFDGKVGDIIVGGGRGEAPAFRISIPNAIDFFINDDLIDFENLDKLFKCFWTPTQSYILCEGFTKIGWSVKAPIEVWFAENICIVLIRNLSQYSNYLNKNIPQTNLIFDRGSSS